MAQATQAGEAVSRRHRSLLNAEDWRRLPDERPARWPAGNTWDVLLAHVREGESYRSLGERLGVSELQVRIIAYDGRRIAVRLGVGPLSPWLDR
jgi:hypothetical protein